MANDQSAREGTKKPKTTEQSRGAILQKKIAITNNFIEDEYATGMQFGEYLSTLDMTEQDFFQDLPTNLRLENIIQKTAMDIDFQSYHTALANYYTALHIAHLKKNPDSPLTENEAPATSTPGQVLGGLAQQAADYQSNTETIERGVNYDPDHFPLSYNADGTPRWQNFSIKGFHLGADLQKAIDDVKKGAQVVYDDGTKAVKAPIRGAFLGLLDVNFVGMATALQIIKSNKDQTHWNKILANWKDNLEGNDVKLTNAVNIGKLKPELFKGHAKNTKSADATVSDLNPAPPPSNASEGDLGKDVGEAANALAVVPPALLVIPGGQPFSATAGAADIALKTMHPILDSFGQSKGAPPSKPYVGVNGKKSTGAAIGAAASKYKGYIFAAAALLGVLAIVSVFSGKED